MRMETNPDENGVMSKHPEWTFSQERVFVAELVHKRLTLYLTFFAIVMAGTVNTIDTPMLQLVILFAGFVVCAPLGETVVRSHEKLDIALRKINEEKNHPVSWISR